MRRTLRHDQIARLLLGGLVVLGACTAGPSTAPPPADGTASVGPGSLLPELPSGPDRLAIELVTDGISAPTGIVAAGDGGARLFVTERAGAIRVVSAQGELRDDPFVDLSDRVLGGSERGLLGLAFHPQFAENGRLFVDYTRTGDGATVVSELTASQDRRHADASSERVLLTVPQPYANHNGGQLAFGPDGYLYIGLGDGGGGGDPLGNAQNRDVLLGKILRIDVNAPPGSGRAYAIPNDNPYASGGEQPAAGRPEIWAYGLRNPWRFSFDPEGGDLYIGDVGQNDWEEVDRQPGDAGGGANYGWNVMEGRHCYAEGCDQTGYVKPIAEYGHDQGCAISGGYVYRGPDHPEMSGVYVFGDYCSGTIFTLQVDEGTITPKPVLESGLSISSFGVDERGELYVADISGGGIYRVLPG